MKTSAPPENTYLTVEQVAKRLNVSTDSIWRWKRAGKFPLAVRVGPNCTRWRLSDIEAYESQLQTCFMMDGECPTFCVSVIWSMLPERSKDDDDFERTVGRVAEGLQAA